MGLRQGVEHVRSAQERAKNRNTNNIDTNWIWWKDGDEKVLRFLTDMSEIYVLYTHDRVPAKDGKQKNFICRQEFDASCELCEDGVYRAEVGYALAVLRKETIGEEDGQKKITGYEDYTEEKEIEEDGKKVTKVVPYVGIVSQKIGNFWTYIDAMYNKYGSLKNYDIAIERRGADQSTTYMPFYTPPIEIKDIDKRYVKYTPDLKGFLERTGSMEYYDKQLRGIEPKKNGSSTPSQPAPTQTNSADEETELDRLRQAQEKLSKEASPGSYE